MAISQHGVPPQLEDCRRTIEALQTEMEIIGREETVGINADERRKAGGGEARVERAAARLVGGAVERRARAGGARPGDSREAPAGKRAGGRHGQQAGAGRGGAEDRRRRRQPPRQVTPEERQRLLGELAELQAKLSDLQGESPLILPSVDEQAVGSVVQDWTGVPVGRMVKNEIETVLNLAETLNQRVIGQRHALDMIARRIQTSRAKLDNPNKPIGVFMLCGPSGVGKTETALTLAEALYGGEQNVITINMSEFQEEHTVSTLKGSPPGYVGYGEGGVLTEAVRRRPYSVVLLDEIEKAHSDVHELFFQVFDKGWMEDGEGRRIDFKNTIILLTSNVGTDLIMSMCKDPELMPEPEGMAKALREPLLKKFPAALLGRLVVIPYYPLSDAMLAEIVRLQLGRIAKRVTEHHKIPFDYDDDAVKLIVSRCTEVESGGRMIDAILTNTVLPAISHEFLTRTMAGAALERRASGGGRRRFRIPVRVARASCHRSSGAGRCSASDTQNLLEQPMEPSEAPTRELTLDEAVSIAIRLQKNEQFAEAEVVYRRILEVAPDHPTPCTMPACSRINRDEATRPSRSSRGASALAPGRADWYSNLGIVLQAQGRLDEAIDGLSARHRARSESRQCAQQSGRAVAGDGQAGRSGSGVSDRHSTGRPITSMPTPISASC